MSLSSCKLHCMISVGKLCKKMRKSGVRNWRNHEINPHSATATHFNNIFQLILIKRFIAKQHVQSAKSINDYECDMISKWF